MRRKLLMSVAFLAPIATAAALIYKIVEGEVKDPVFFVLLVVLPATLLSAIRELSSVLPPSKVQLTFLPGIRANHWDQASNYNRQGRDVTSLYIPIKIVNTDPAKSVTLFDVSIIDAESGALLEPPKLVEVSLGVKKEWCYLACNLAPIEILNAGTTTVEAASFTIAPIVIQENYIHREAYNLEITLKDNYGRVYILKQTISVELSASRS